jgi:hypothetical protein
LITSSAGGPQDAEQKDIRSACHRALSEISSLRDWQWYHKHGRIDFQASWTGTVTYNSSTKTFYRVSGDAFPSYADRSSIRVNDVVSRITTRTDDNYIIADSTINHPVDLSTATSATIFRSIYPLPIDFKNIDSPIDQNALTNFLYVEQDTAMKGEGTSNRHGPPHAWTVIQNPYLHIEGPWAIQVLGYPTEVEALDFTYRREPRPIRTSGHEASARAGTVTVSGTTVTGTATAFTDEMVGSIIRFGTSTTMPDTLSSLNPFVREAKITAVASATSLTIDTSISSGVDTNAKYLVTDPIDASPQMRNCILSAMDYWLARTRKDPETDNRFALYQRDLRLALETDQLAPIAGSERIIWDTLGWRSPLKADNYQAQ